MLQGTPTISRIALGLFKSTSDEGDVAFVQGRISMFSRVLLALMLAYVAVMITVGFAFGGPTRQFEARAWPGIAIVITIVVASWLYTRGAPRSPGALALIDAALLIDVGLVAGGTILFVAKGTVPGAPFVSFMGIMLCLFGRALIVPSYGPHTAIMSFLGCLPIVLANAHVALLAPEKTVLQPAPVQVALIATWAVLASCLAGYGSHVIYGLRAEVRAAQQLGQYTLTEKIGEGGVGAVYRARHAMLRRPTAVKLLHAKAGVDQSATSRFEREVQLTAELGHPNIVQIYDYGRSVDGIFYYAMELLDGMDLDQLVRISGPQPPGRVVRILAQVCGALAEAHERGMVHRDIKPANVFLCRRVGVPDVVKVLDFGLVKQLAAGDPKVTDVNVIAGTPAFMPPEALTRPDHVGPASDLYALGGVAYFMLCGEQVFEGRTVVEVASHHLHTSPRPPSARLGRPLPAELERLVLACLAKEPSGRPESAASMRRALMAMSEHEAWSEDDARSWWQEHGQAPRPATNVATGTAVAIDLRAR